MVPLVPCLGPSVLRLLFDLFLTLGYLSILSWLCAQLPQVITNYQNSSVDGLAPMFLANWFMV